MKPTTDEVLAWAREAGLCDWETSAYRNEYTWACTLAYAAGVKAMQERAAKVCDEWANYCAAEQDFHGIDAAETCGIAIRELGDDDDDN